MKNGNKKLRQISDELVTENLSGDEMDFMCGSDSGCGSGSISGTCVINGSAGISQYGWRLECHASCMAKANYYIKDGDKIIIENSINVESVNCSVKITGNSNSASENYEYVSKNSQASTNVFSTISNDVNIRIEDVSLPYEVKCYVNGEWVTYTSGNYKGFITANFRVYGTYFDLGLSGEPGSIVFHQEE